MNKSRTKRVKIKWFDYPSFTPKSNGFYDVRGRYTDRCLFECKAYWDGRTFKIIDDEIETDEIESIYSFSERYSRGSSLPEFRRNVCNGFCSECKDYVKCSKYFYDEDYRKILEDYEEAIYE